MSSFYRNKLGHVVVQYYDNTTRKPKKLPRSTVRILDTWTDADIQIWLADWDQKNGLSAYKITRKVLLGSDDPLKKFKEFLAERTRLRNLSSTTASDELGRFWRHIVPYFVSHHGEKDLRQWGRHVPDYTTFLMTREEPLEINQIKKVLGLLARFGRYLAGRRLIEAPWTPLLPTLGRALPTPLKFVLTPEDVLKFVTEPTKPPVRIQLMALLGFFASLGPGETFALERADFLTGEAAKKAAKTYTRLQERGLGSGLSVHVNKAVKRTGRIGSPKTNYRNSYVNVWDKAAARLIAGLIRELPEGRLFPDTRTKLFAAWKEGGMPALGVTLHDLRRASGQYLGRGIGLELLLLQDHMRHGDVKMTLEYTRNPVVTENVTADQDWDDVG